MLFSCGADFTTVEVLLEKQDFGKMPQVLEKIPTPMLQLAVLPLTPMHTERPDEKYHEFSFPHLFLLDGAALMFFVSHPLPSKPL